MLILRYIIRVMDNRKVLDLIVKTHLLFEDEAELMIKLGLGKDFLANRNQLSRPTRPDDKIKENIKTLLDYASEISAKILTDKSELRLLLVINDYYQATKSGNFATPANDRHKKYGDNRLFYNSLKRDCKKFMMLIKDVVAKGKPDMQYKELYSALHIDIEKPYTLYRNYYAAIGLLIYSKCIPFCEDSLRFSKNQWNLKRETDEILQLVESVFDLKQERYTKIRFWVSYIKNYLSTTKEWCRYLLILSLTKIIDEYIEIENPKLIDSYEINPKIPDSKYWYNVSKNWSACIIERPDPNPFYDLYIYEYFTDKESQILKKRRVNLKFKSRVTLELSYIDDLYNIITKGVDEDASWVTILSMDEDSILIGTGDGEMLFKSMTLNQINDFEQRLNLIEKSGGKVSLENEDKAREKILPLAVLDAIFLEPRTFRLHGTTKDQSLYQVTPNPNNGLDKDFDEIKAFGGLYIYEIDNELYLVKIIKGMEISCKVTNRFEEYGIRKLK